MSSLTYVKGPVTTPGGGSSSSRQEPRSVGEKLGPNKVTWDLGFAQSYTLEGIRSVS